MMRHRMFRRGALAVGMAMALYTSIGAMTASAATTSAEPASEEPSLLHGWTFTVAPYLWTPAVNGRVGAGGATVGVDVGLDDVYDLIGDGFSLLAAFGRIEAQHGRFLGFVDTSLIRLDTDTGAQLRGLEKGPLSTTPINVDATLRLDAALVEFGVGYRVLQYSFLNRSRPFIADVLLGGRYYYFWTQAKVKASTKLLGLPSGPQVLRAAGRKTTTIDWADPLIGLRWSIPVLENLDLSFRGDVGGFEVGSDLAWSLTGLLRYHLPWRPCGADPSLALGYRILDFDWESRGRELDLTMSGPVLGLAMQF